ncbi:hypothetical protein ACHWQZ_G007585 [Mnemiopsis leidyi]
MSDRRKGYQHESNKTADLIENYLDSYEKHTSTNRRLPTGGQASLRKQGLRRESATSSEKRGTYANAPRFDPRVEDVALKSAPAVGARPSTTVGTPRARSADSVLQSSIRNTTSTSRLTVTASAPKPRIKNQKFGERSSAESRLRKLLTPHYPNTAPNPTPSVRSASLSPKRSFRRDDHISSTSRTKRDDELWTSSNKAGWQSPSTGTITRKSILRHSIGIDNPRRYRETFDSSSSADSHSFHSDKRVRFQDQVRVKRKIAPSPELVKLVRTDSENSLTSSSSGNLNSNSELSVSSGTGSLPDFHLVDYSLGSEDSSQKSGQGQGGSTRQSRQYSSNDSDYSTENESLYGIDRLRKHEARYSSNESFKSSAYSSSSSVKSSESFSNSKIDPARPRIKSESSEDEPVQRRINKIHLKEVHAESDEDAKSDSSNSTLADTSSSENEIVLASGIVITREKFTSGSEFESSAESIEDMSEAENSGKWFMTVKEHRASSPSNFDEEQVMEKEIYFKYKESRGKTKDAETVEQDQIPEAQFITVENVDFEEIRELKRPNPTRPKPIKPVQIIVQSVSDSDTDRAISVEKESIKRESRSPQISDLESLKSVTLRDGELDDITDGSLSLTHITTLEGSLTQTSVFTLPLLDRHSPNLEDIKSVTESSNSSSTRGVHAPYHLVKQIVKQNEALYQLQQQAKLNKLVSYSCSSLSSSGTDPTESLVSLIEDNDPSAFAPGYFYDSFGNKKRVMVSTATSTVFGSGYSLEKPFSSEITAGKFRNEEARRTYFNQKATQAPSDIAATEILLLDPSSRRKQKTLVSLGVQTDQVGYRRFTLQKQTSAPSAFKEYSKTSTTSDFAHKEFSRSLSYDKNATTIETDTLLSSIKIDPSRRSKLIEDRESFVSVLKEKKPSLLADGGRSTKNTPKKKFAYKKEKKEESACNSSPETEIAAAGDGKFVKEFSISSETDSVISFHECHEEVISQTDLLESNSSDQSSLSLDSSHFSDTEELRVSLKISRDLSKADTSDNDMSTEESDADSLRPEISFKTSPKLEDREDDRSRPLSLRTCNSVTSTSSVQSADQRLIETVMREVEEMIQESKNSSSQDNVPREKLGLSDSSLSNGQLNTSEPADSQNFSENVSSYSVGEIISDPKKSVLVHSIPSVKNSQAEIKEAALNKDLSVEKSGKSVESEFEKLHREMREMMESGTGSQRSLTSKQSTSNSTLRKIPSITSSTSSSSEATSGSNKNKLQKSGSSMSFEQPSSSGEDQKLDREYDRDDDSDGQIIIETIGIVSDSKSESSSRFKRKVPARFGSYGAISDPEAILRMSKRSSASESKESSRLVRRHANGNSTSRSNRNVPRLASLSSTQKCTDIGIVTSNKSKKRNTSSENSGGDCSDNKIGKSPSTRTSAYSRKLRASSGAPFTAGKNGGAALVDYDATQSATTVSSDSELSPDELDDLVYSLKISKPRPSESEGEDQRTFCENCRTEKNSCECSHTCNSEITDSYRYKRGRWAENYGVVRALKWIFCPCREG